MAFNWDGFGNSWSCNSDTENLCGSKTDSKGFYESFNDDIVDRLSEDPFGMEIRSTFPAAITGWFQDFENDLWSDFCMFGMQNVEEKNISDQQHVFKGLNCVWNGTMGFQYEESISSCYGFSSKVGKTIGDQSSFFKGVNWIWNNVEINGISYLDDDFNGFGIDYVLSIGGSSTNDEGKGLEDCKRVICDASEGGDPSDAFLFALGYLGVKDLLMVERVCRSLRDAVRSDILLWRSIRIEHSLSRRITDDALLKLTNRAQGSLESLSLVQCVKITDDGLKCVLESNPNVTTRQ